MWNKTQQNNEEQKMKCRCYICKFKKKRGIHLFRNLKIKKFPN